MKSERKQVQESNLLADKIEALFVKIKKVLPTLLVVIGVSVVGLLAYGIYSSVQESYSAKAWTAYYFSDTETADLNAVSSDFANSTAGLWAKHTAGDAYMAKALEKVYIDRDLSDQYYKQALDEYKAVAEQTSDAYLKERALYGAAQASEGLGEREEAISYYRRVAVLSGLNPEFLAEVNKRVAWLDSKAGEQFYVWFKANRPAAPTLQNAAPTKLPLPSNPTIDLPPVPSLTKPAQDPSAVPEAEPGKPAAESTPAIPSGNESATPLTLPEATPPAADTKPSADPK
jgi:tetratricopeptide (TPR) repeat protein